MPLLSVSRLYLLFLVPTFCAAWVLPPIQQRVWKENSNVASRMALIASSNSLALKPFGSRNGLLQQSASPTTTTTATEETSWPEITLYNSLSRSKEPLKPIHPGTFRMYTCGPTVYDCAHIGNFRAFLTYDILKRVLQYFGYDVTHICNLTDVDDKIIQRATELGLESALELTQKFEQLFREDLHALNIVPATQYPRATEHVREMKDMILELRDKELAYETSDGSWYFRTQAQDGYGQQLVQFREDASEDYNADNNSDEEEGTVDEKEHFQDFCLWKAYKPGVDRDDLVWEFPGALKKGRPGWHLECSAMARKYLGDTIDLHGGGIDLKFPHHENEIAQSQGVTGAKFCNCWFHNGFVNIDAEKMSKSLGNFLTLSKACPTALDVRAYRYLVVSSQYRNALNFSPDAMKAAKSALKRMDAVREQLEEALKSSNIDEDKDSDSSLAKEAVPKALENFDAALKDDLSMPRAAASLFGLVKAAENEFKKKKKDDNYDLDLVGLNAIQWAMERMDMVFGVFYRVPDTHAEEESEEDASVPEEVMALVEQRTSAKEAKDWELADSLRARITELGFAVKDVKGDDPIISRVD
mgnify:CR=1 FL=1